MLLVCWPCSVDGMVTRASLSLALSLIPSPIRIQSALSLSSSRPWRRASRLHSCSFPGGGGNRKQGDSQAHMHTHYFHITSNSFFLLDPPRDDDRASWNVGVDGAMSLRVQ